MFHGLLLRKLKLKFGCPVRPAGYLEASFGSGQCAQKLMMDGECSDVGVLKCVFRKVVFFRLYC
jgi:hypothetical protein